ncbi:MAG: carboxylesterase family protein, partial [bacterium]
SPDAAGLFQSAAIQSGPCSLLAKVLDNSINEKSLAPPLLQLHAPILAETGCHVAGDPLTCLRQTTGSELFAAAAGVQQASGFVGSIFTPNIDGEVVVSNPLSALENNVVGNIPLIVGANDDEGGAVLGGQVPTLDDAGYRNALLNFWDQSTADALYDLYPSSEYPTPTDAYRTLFGDLGINCVAEQLANAAKGGAPSYLYTLTRGFDKLSGGNTGAVHGVDVPYLFLTSGAFGYDTDTQSTAISQAMWRGWIGLAENPNVAPMLTSQITWPAFDSINRPYAEFGEVIDARSNHREGRCPQLAAILN